MREILKRFSKLFFLFVAGLFSLTLSFFFVLVLVVGFQTSKGPLDLTFVKPHLQNILKHTSYDFTYDALKVIWPTLDDPIILRAHKVTAQKQNKAGHPVWAIDIKNIELVYPFSSIWHTKGVPSHVSVQGAITTVNKSFFKSIETEGQKEKLDINFKSINKVLRSVVHLKKMDLLDCKVSLIQKNQRTTFDISGNLAQDSEKLFGNINVENTQDSGLVTLEISYPFVKNILTLKVNSQGFDSHSVKTFFSSDILDKIFFQDSKVKLVYDYFLKTRKHEGRVTFSVIGLVVSDACLWKEPLSFPEVTFNALLKDSRLSVKTFKTDIHGVPVYMKMTGDIDSETDRISSTVSVFVENLTFQDVPKLWPRKAAPDPREWITENIQKGKVPKAAFVLESILDFSGKGPFFQLVKLGGEINLTETILTYQKTMPAITDIKAKAIYDQEHFDIKIESANHNGLQLKDAHVFIGKFSDPVPHIDIKAKIVGDLGRALSIIDRPPLSYGKDIGLDPMLARGRLSGNFKMSFPLSSPFDSSAIQTYFKGTVAKAGLGNIVNLNLNLTKGDIGIDLTPDGIQVMAHGLVNKQISKISVHQNFKKELLKISAKTFLSNDFLEDYKKGISALFKGSAQTTITYEQHKKKPGSLVMISDLKNVAINTLIMKKQRNIPGSLRFEGRFNEGKLLSFSPLSYEDKNGWKILISGFKDKNNSPKTIVDGFDVRAKHHGKPILNLTFWPNKYGSQVLDIQGEDVNLKTYFETDLSNSGLVSEKIKSMPLHLVFKAKRITVNSPLGIVNPYLDVHFENSAIKLLQFRGQTEEGVGGNRDIFAEIHNQVTGPNKGMRKLRLQTEQGGAFLRALDIFKNIRGGQLKIIAFNDQRFQKKTWIGKVRMRSFSLLDTPFITRLLALIPSGGAELTPGNGIKMATLKMRFGISDTYFEIHGLRAYGMALGVNLSGFIEKARSKSINIKGSIIPMRGLNTAISHIPIVGPLITGGQNGSLFSVAFGVGGTTTNPKITSNPLSVLTPGILKHFFGGKENKFTISDKWLNEKDGGKRDVFDEEFDNF